MRSQMIAAYNNKKVAEELISETPKRSRSRFARELAARRNPDWHDEWEVKKAANKDVLDLAKAIGAQSRDARKIAKKDVLNRYRIAIEFGGIPSGMPSVWLKGWRKGLGNPGTKKIDISDVERMSKEFHGREPKEVLEVTELEEYNSALTILGDLVEIAIENGKKELCIHFPKGDRPKLCCDASGENLEIIGGDQQLELEDAPSKGKFPLGYAVSIAYSTDKHHLEDSNGEMCEYQHEFSDESGGELPMVVYDTRNQKIELVGGSYIIVTEGIKN